MTTVRFEKHIDIHTSGYTLIGALIEHCDLSQKALKEALDKGCVWLSRQGNTRRVRRVKTELKPSDRVNVYYDSAILNQTVPACTLIQDEGAYSVWFKPYGVYSQGSKWGDHCTVTRDIEKQTQHNVFIVHRLDRAAQGLMVVAHKKATCTQLASLFSHRGVFKRYQAIVHGLYPITEKAMTITAPIDDKPSVSHVTCLSHNEGLSLVDVRIETGRKHQIRKHLASVGFPIVGDRLHGIDQQGSSKDLQLCSSELSFKCPLTGQNKHYTLTDALTLKL